ncbi:MAG: VOC family protein [Sphaerochaeta sp.]
MKIRYAHTNIIAHDYKLLASFYQDVFGYTQVGPTRDLSGSWVNQLTNRVNTTIIGVHLELEEGGPTLEIFQYETTKPSDKTINTSGFSHIAFAVEDVTQTINSIIAHGGSSLGAIADGMVEGVGMINVAYAKDPEGNILEIQKWD